jgi:AraC-like DNA-binding protein
MDGFAGRDDTETPCSTAISAGRSPAHARRPRVTAPKSTPCCGQLCIRFNGFTLLRGPAPLSYEADADALVIRLSQVTVGKTRTWGLPDLMRGTDAARQPAQTDAPTVLMLVCPPGAAGRVAPPKDARMALAGAAGALIRNHLILLAGLLPYAGKGDMALIAGTTAGFLSTCLAPATPPDLPEKAVAPALRRAEVDRVIRQNLSSARLDPARISALVGMSRSALYRLFRDTGGVAGYVRALRLEQVRDDLCDPALAHKSITEIAQANGLHCTASFGRSFRQTFGRTPSEVRARALLHGMTAAEASALCDASIGQTG